MIPAGDAQNPPGRQAFQKKLPGFERVKGIFRQNQGTRRRGGPCVDERNLNHVERVALPGDIAARLVVYE